MARKPLTLQTAATYTATVQDPSRIPLHVTPDELAKCIETHRRELANIIRNQHSAPIDGGVFKIVGALDALARIDPTEA